MANSNVDDENYELVDYTAASSWEKFIASIEAVLYKWKVSDGGLGEFRADELSEKCQQLLVKHKQDRSRVLAQIAELCTRESQLSFRGTAYALTLSLHPLMPHPDSSKPLPGTKSARLDGLFPPVYATELEVDRGHSGVEPAWHPMHRWTGSRLIMYLRYLGDESDWAEDTLDGDTGSAEIGGNYSVSLETAKLLMSSMNIAAQNVRCQVPVFVPVGDAWRYLFTGRSLGRALATEQANREEAGASHSVMAVEKKFESAYLAQAPSAYLQLNGLVELYSNSFRILANAPFAKDGGQVDRRSSNTAVAALTQEWEFVSKTVSLSALHVYTVKNTYSRDWNTASSDFQYRAGDLNIGPANDPLRTITLSALFQPSPCGMYIDPQPTGRDKLYLKTATAWSLSAQLLPADMERTMLTEALEDAFAAWTQSADQASRHRHLSLSEQMEAHAEITSDMLIDLFGASGNPHIAPPGLAVDTMDEQASRAFEERLERTISEVYANARPASRPSTVTQLIARMPHGTAVPYRSLLWRLSEIILVATAKRSADFWRAPSIMTFLRLLWAMALKEVRWRWENERFLPKVATEAEYAAGQDGVASGAETPTSSSAAATGASLAGSNGLGIAPARYNVHLKHLLVYQKLEMLNCCQERRLLRRDPPPSHTGHAALHMFANVEAASASPSGGFAKSCSLKDSGGRESPESDGLIRRIRSHVHDQIRSRPADAGPASGQGAWVPGSRIRRPIGRLLKSIRSQDGRSSTSDSVDSPRSPSGDLDGFEEIKADSEANDSDGFVSAEEVDAGCNDENEDDGCDDGGCKAVGGDDKDCDVCPAICIDDDSNSALSLNRESSIDDRATLSSFASVRLPANAARSTSEVDVSSKGVSIPGQSNRDSNYVDLTMSSSVDSTSGFHHISDVYERERPSVMAGGSCATPSLTAAKPTSDTGAGASPRKSSNARSSGAPEKDAESKTPGEPASDERVGGLVPSENLKLLGSNEPLWIPKIQMPPVLTEDMLREREAILMGLGTSSEGAKQRAKLQCAELISDMESFKAANPSCSLADFVRWHSPRDWIVPEGSDEKDGSLSVRMSEGEGNLWQQLWTDARRVPADKQKLLFDYEMEAEKALHYLEGIPVHSLFTGLLPTIFLIAYERLYRQPVIHRMECLRAKLAAIGRKIVLEINWLAVDPESPIYSSLLDGLEDLEVQASRCISLLHKFPEQYSLVERLVTCGRATVDDRKEQRVVLKFLSKHGISTMAPTRREYVFSSQAPDLQPVSDSNATTQRMHVAIEDDKSIRVVHSRVKVQGTAAE